MKESLESDLHGSQNIRERVAADPIYAQNLYAAMCNMSWKKNGEEWSCSWRYAGGIVAAIKGSGDYIDYYCSGIGGYDEGCVEEGIVTDRIRGDLLELGWTPEELV